MSRFRVAIWKRSPLAKAVSLSSPAASWRYSTWMESFTLDGICPHAGGPLAKGALNGNVVTCPWHGWQFDDDGSALLERPASTPNYSVMVDGPDLWLMSQ